MPKKLFKRIMPTPERLKEHRYLRLLGDALHDGNLWHLNRHSAALAAFIGVFCAFIPVPFQMLLAAALAIGLRANLPLSVALVWISNPLTMPPLLYGSYRLGALIQGLPPKAFTLSPSALNIDLSLDQWWHGIKSSWQPLLRPLFVGGFICGLFFGGLAYSAVRISWRVMVLRNWRKRVRLRRLQPAAARARRSQEPGARAPGARAPGAPDTAARDVEVSEPGRQPASAICRSAARPPATGGPPAMPDKASPPE